jgi:4-amino-4-deoxy-L-arabinose transferase-like glycosyltransferase
MLAKNYRYAFFALCTGLILRALFLEHPNLIDPTEARYAVVAQNMVTSDNWLTPTLPLENGIEPYLGKPPLHFWLTAIAYKFFGFHEWTSRLPSFLATIVALFSVFFITRKIWGERTAWLSALIYLSCSMVYLLSGASVTDVTLATTCTLATGALFVAVREKSTRWAWIAAAGAALGFLTKGPVSLVLVWAPLVFWSILSRDISWVRKFPWFSSLLVFLAITSPWFILNELSNPGFNRYFFWNENLARYLFKNYGDKYGSGHVHAYGSSWLMLFVGFLPWSIFAYFFAIKSCVKTRCILPKTSCADHLFVWCWAITTPLFFTFVRQLHAMYLLPALAPASMLMAHWISSHDNAEGAFKKIAQSRNTIPIVVAVNLILTIVGFRLVHSWDSVIFAVLLIALCLAALKIKSYSQDLVSLVARACLIIFFTFSTGFAAFSDFLSATRSSEDIIELLVSSDTCKGDTAARTIGVSTHNSFSHYWTANAWETELAGPVLIKYFDPNFVKPEGLCAYLLKSKRPENAPQNLQEKFRLHKAGGDWLVFVPK